MSAEKRVFFIGGNWKCNGSIESVKTLVSGLNALPKFRDNLQVLVAPIALHVPFVMQTIRKDILVSTQNCFPKCGAFTGEHSVNVIKDFGINWTLIGHSERRHKFGECEELLGEKLVSAQTAKLSVIYCIGEQEGERENNETDAVLKRQLSNVLNGTTDWSQLVLAYEPVWAIGTGKSATPAMAQETHAAIRALIQETAGAEVANKVRILYGGSVKPANCVELSQCPDIDGFLIGGASLKAASFGEIIEKSEI